MADAGFEAASQALAMAWDALEHVNIDSALIEAPERAEDWQAGIDNLYLALFNLHALRVALEEGVAISAASLHDEVLRHLGGGNAAPHLSALTSGALQAVTPLGKLTLFAGLLREVTAARWTLPDHPAAFQETLSRIHVRLERLGADIVALAEPLLAAALHR